MPNTSISLPPVPAGLQEHADRISAIATRGVAVFQDLGIALTNAKQACPRGQWLHFLASVGVHERTAQRAMAFARKLDEMPAGEVAAITSIREFLGDPAPKLPLERDPTQPITPVVVGAGDDKGRGAAWDQQAGGMAEAARENRKAARAATTPTPSSTPAPVATPAPTPSTPGTGKYDSESYLPGIHPAADQEIDRLRADRARLEARVDKLTVENGDLARRIEIAGSPNVTREIESLQALLRVTRGQLADWQQKYEGCRRERNALKARVKALEGENGC